MFRTRDPEVMRVVWKLESLIQEYKSRVKKEKEKFVRKILEEESFEKMYEKYILENKGLLGKISYNLKKIFNRDKITEILLFGATFSLIADYLERILVGGSSDITSLIPGALVGLGLYVLKEIAKKEYSNIREYIKDKKKAEYLFETKELPKITKKFYENSHEFVDELIERLERKDEVVNNLEVLKALARILHIYLRYLKEESKKDEKMNEIYKKYSEVYSKITRLLSKKRIKVDHGDLVSNYNINPLLVSPTF